MQTAFLYPGQGAQMPGFLHRLPAHPAVGRTLDEASDVLGLDALSLDSETALASTVAVQLSGLIVGVATTRALDASGVRADAVAGLSSGAYTAACACGALEFSDALRLLKLRAQWMETAYPHGFGLVALVGLDEARVKRLIGQISGQTSGQTSGQADGQMSGQTSRQMSRQASGQMNRQMSRQASGQIGEQTGGQVSRHASAQPGTHDAMEGNTNDVTHNAESGEPLYIANLNAPRQIVLAGSDEALAVAIESALRAGARKAQKMAVSVPSHCALMNDVAARLAAAFAHVRVAPPRIPYIGNVNARALRNADDIARDLASNVAHTVRWHDAMTLLYEMGVRHFFEAPPGAVLTGLMHESFPDAKARSLADTPVDTVVYLADRARVDGAGK